MAETEISSGGLKRRLEKGTAGLLPPRGRERLTDYTKVSSKSFALTEWCCSDNRSVSIVSRKVPCGVKCREGGLESDKRKDTDDNAEKDHQEEFNQI
jgi:hypothetical protein